MRPKAYRICDFDMAMILVRTLTRKVVIRLTRYFSLQSTAMQIETLLPLGKVDPG